MTAVEAALTPAAERLLAAASELFYERGIRAVGVDAIAEAAGTTKKTLYDRFGSKDALVALYLTHRARRWQQYLEEEIARRTPGTDRVLAVFDAADAFLAGRTRGCAFVNAYAEVGGTDHPAVPVIRAEKDWMRRRFTELAAQAGTHPAAAAATLHLLYEGALVTATAGNDPAALRTAREAAARLLG